MSPAGCVTVLLVEDSPGDARLTREMLADAGHGQITVKHVTTLQEACALVASGDPDAPIEVVLLDLSLPDSQGLDGVLRLQAVNPRLPIIVLTGLDDEAVSVEAAQVGAQDYLVKGQGDGEVIARAIRYSIERMRAHIQLREEKDRAELASRTKSEFLTNMSHELRTPLNAIIGFSEIIQDELMGPLGVACYKEYAGNIRDSGTHLLAIINDILDLSKIEAGKIELSEEIVDVARVIYACTRLIGGRASDARVILEARVAPGLPPILADERKIKQALINLLSNAVKFTPEGGRVLIAVGRHERGGIEIVVEDTGIGIAGGDIARALAPFHQIDNSLSRKHSGTGLGLPLARSFIGLHGGELTLDSAEGRGTRVTVVLPESRVISVVT